MKISPKKSLIFMGLFFVLIFAANSFISKSVSKLLSGSEDNATIANNDLNNNNQADRATTIRPWKEADAQKLEEIKKYGIKIKPRNYGPSTIDQWDEYIEKRINESKIFESKSAKEAVKTMQVTEQEYNEKIEVNKKHEEEAKKLLIKDPFNKKYKDRLQNIYKMRAIGKAMKDKIIVHPDVN